ncbi:hypothetical protein AGR7A_pAt30129 [Agrobacterium deltaense NCPPB 1641]|uniref:Uncharacterized protein n=1 Tax=Agrobacterium deltaense NCPPB 1641 TaxID=1183425 RepID=A0A1S7UBX0_9HYPH|nr:hypothetical protein AGR7A_pAt30129 [Agrobacterium deltaense NCPPB 1641]
MTKPFVSTYGNSRSSRLPTRFMSVRRDRLLRQISDHAKAGLRVPQAGSYWSCNDRSANARADVLDRHAVLVTGVDAEVADVRTCAHGKRLMNFLEAVLVCDTQRFIDVGDVEGQVRKASIARTDLIRTLAIVRAQVVNDLETMVGRLHIGDDNICPWHADDGLHVLRIARPLREQREAEAVSKKAHYAIEVVVADRIARVVETLDEGISFRCRH